jgi:hypothetical protein
LNIPKMGCGNDSRSKQPYYISVSSRYPSDGNYTGPDAHLVSQITTVFERRPYF